jgi:hypothetical protein
LPERKHRRVARKAVDVKCFEADPHRMRRIGKSAVRDGIAHHEVAEFVVDAGHRDWKAGKKRETNCDYQQEEKYAANHGLARERENAAANETRDAVAPTTED